MTGYLVARRMYRSLLVSCLVAALASSLTQGFAPTKIPKNGAAVFHQANSRHSVASTTSRSMVKEEYTREARLREEAESPFRKVRYFFYFTLSAGALTSLLISLARIAAAVAGVNTDLMDESIRNGVIDVTGLIAMAYFYKQDMAAEESRLKRASKGAAMAKLSVRISKALVESMSEEEEKAAGTTNVSLASLRRGRGIDKRVIIAAGGKEKLDSVLDDTRTLADSLALNDLVIVPVLMPEGTAPLFSDGASTTTPPSCVAAPISVGNNWKRFVTEEAQEAIDQGVDVEKEGFCVILKKNGRVGQRTRGIFLNNLVGNVEARKEAGMDVTNI